MNECISLFSSSAAQPMNLGGKYKAHANLCNLHSGAVIFHENPNIILNRMISIDIAWTGAKFLDLRSSHHRHWGLFDKGIGEFRSELRGWEGTSPIYNQHWHKLTVDNIMMDLPLVPGPRPGCSSPRYCTGLLIPWDLASSAATLATWVLLGPCSCTYCTSCTFYCTSCTTCTSYCTHLLHCTSRTTLHPCLQLPCTHLEPRAARCGRRGWSRLGRSWGWRGGAAAARRPTAGTRGSCHHSSLIRAASSLELATILWQCFHNHGEGSYFLLGLSPGWKCMLLLSHLRHY